MTGACPRRSMAAVWMLIAMVACRESVQLEELIEPAGLDQAEASVSRGYSERASRLATLLERQDRGDPVVSAQLLAAYSDFGRWLFAYQYDESAAPLLRNAWILAPKDFQWPYLLSMVAQRSGDVELARSLLEETLELEGNYIPAVTELASLAAGEGDTAEARRLLGGASAVPRVLFELAQLDISEGDFETAKQRLEQVVTSQPESTAAHQSLGIALRSMGETEQADQHLELAAVKIGKSEGLVVPSQDDSVVSGAMALREDSRRLVERARRLARTGEGDRAMALFERAVAAAPKSVVPRVAFARFLAEQGRGPKAVKVLSEALEIEPGNTQARLQLARILSRDGNLEAALLHLERVVTEDRRNGEARGLLARILEHLGDRSGARAQLLELLEVDPGSVVAYQRLTRMSMADGDCSEARRLVDRARGLHPQERAFDYRAVWLTATCESSIAAFEAAERVLGKLQAAGSAVSSGMVEVHWVEYKAALASAAGRWREAVRLQRLVVERLRVEGKLSGRVRAATEGRLKAYEAGGKVPRQFGPPLEYGVFMAPVE